MHHTYYTEKIFFGTTNLVAAAFGLLGAMINEGDARWICVTMSVGIIVSTSMALMTRRDESMRIITGRSLFAVITSIFGTRALAHYILSLAPVNDDILLLGFVSGCVTVLTFTVGYGLIRSLNDQKFTLGAWIIEILRIFLAPKK